MSKQDGKDGPAIKPAINIDIAHVARLARLALTEDETTRMGGEIADILSYVAQLHALDLTDVPPTTHVLPVSSPLREDSVGGTLDHDRALSLAPAHDGEHYVVPKVI
ncbi:MAG: aspartyl-tRNA(Asn)/glutamyl-tRNA(Gln) amidotransferase subunit C [Myxococcota bacterium]|jgi:aspartyl-tRNA(Asn)/glutamyl-tRNA(Gln) amidotransferase subunit C